MSGDYPPFFRDVLVKAGRFFHRLRAYGPTHSRHKLASLALTAALVALSAAAPAQSDDHAIIPGERVGPVQLGMSADEVVGHWGRPEEIEPDKNGGTFYRYASRGILVVLSDDAKPEVSLIEVTDKSYVTDKGVRVGSASSEVASAHGKQDDERGDTDRTHLMAYRNLGLVFRVENASDHVEGILILSRE
jgi:hypothetical protein